MKCILVVLLIFSAAALFAVQDTDFSMTGATLKEKKMAERGWNNYYYFFRQI